MGVSEFSNVGLYIHTTPGWKLEEVKKKFAKYVDAVNKMPDEYRTLLTDGVEIISQASFCDRYSDSPKEEVDDFVIEAIMEIMAEPIKEETEKKTEKFLDVATYIHTTPGWELNRLKSAFAEYLQMVEDMPREDQEILAAGAEMLCQASTYANYSDHSKEEVENFLMDCIEEVTHRM